MDDNTIEEGKTMAAICYITFIGLLIAFLSNKDKNNAFTRFHIGQSLRVWILGLILYLFAIFMVIYTGMGFFGYLGWVGWILAIMGIINAIKGKTDPLPLIGAIGS
ncbi:DUF4870 domain-containing protein [Muriicola sp. Z0-33]|uniref:DUF4870 domain-containing protein n=1 Tax=Muriicola sp. Z0-33 TaxID=2816957 RepID=UPI002238624C|nr:hypothetical protein [Muriicola sp. Z0-33]MCW5516654.1 hypothetical protein [Muriicola sp. Z0-33]